VEAERLAASAMGHHLANLLQLARARNLATTSPIIPPSNIADARSGGWLLVGTADSVADQAAHVLRFTGCNYLVFPPLLGDLPLQHSLDTLDSFTTEVIPAVERQFNDVSVEPDGPVVAPLRSPTRTRP
jgi:alkanesulfonate monooxygenase SsuD/methylene tetrahydromethanopterin reductase-like flavin-dependent oxidoreductase (luciferase family)